jgi:hypothetical protein
VNTVLIKPARESRMAELRTLPMDRLVQMLVDGLVLTVNTIYEMAMIVQVLQEKGVTSVDLRRRIKLFPHLNRINRGELLAELLVKVDSDKERLAALGSLPLALQHRLIEGERVPLSVPGPDGVLTQIMADPFSPEVTEEMLAQAVDAERGCLRSTDQQALIVAARREAAARPLPQKIGPLEIDQERGGAVVRGVFISQEDMRRAVAVLRPRRERPATV